MSIADPRDLYPDTGCGTNTNDWVRLNRRIRLSSTDVELQKAIDLLCQGKAKVVENAAESLVEPPPLVKDPETRV